MVARDYLVLLVGLAAIMHIAAFLRLWWLIPVAYRSRGIGRISVFALASLKIWVVVFLTLTFLLATGVALITPGQTQVLNFLLLGYLILQPVGVHVAIARWQTRNGRPWWKISRRAVRDEVEGGSA